MTNLSLDKDSRLRRLYHDYFFILAISDISENIFDDNSRIKIFTLCTNLLDKILEESGRLENEPNLP